MPDSAISPLAGIAAAYSALAATTSIMVALLSGRSEVPAPLTGHVDDISADLMSGVPAVPVVGWQTVVNAESEPPRAEPRFADTTIPAVPEEAGPITGVVVFESGTSAILYHLQYEEANEIETTGSDVIVTVGADGLVHVYVVEPE